MGGESPFKGALPGKVVREGVEGMAGEGVEAWAGGGGGGLIKQVEASGKQTGYPPDFNLIQSMDWKNGCFLIKSGDFKRDS